MDGSGKFAAQADGWCVGAVVDEDLLQGVDGVEDVVGVGDDEDLVVVVAAVTAT